MNMLFTNTRGYVNNASPIYNPPRVPSSIDYSTPSAPYTIQQQQADAVNPRQKPMKWGQPVWFFFHTVAEKIKDECFHIVKNDLLNIVYTICSNLPCPTCASHATEYLNKINFNAIQNVDQLKDLFFVFHNSVNVRKNFPVFLRKDLDEKYSKANTINIIQNFFNTFLYKNSNMHMIANNMHRIRTVNFIKEWFNSNIQYFNP
jgi:hypothetical protein